MGNTLDKSIKYRLLLGEIVCRKRLLSTAPRFAQVGYAWQGHGETNWAKRVRRSSQSVDGLVDRNVVRLHHQKRCISCSRVHRNDG